MRFLLLLFFPFSLFAQFEVTSTVTNLAALKRLATTGPYKTVIVRGMTNISDGWEGTFMFNSSSILTPDDAMAVQSNLGACCWERQVLGNNYYARWWDTVKTNTTINKAIRWVSTNGGGGVILDGGEWVSKSDTTNRIIMRSNVHLNTTSDSLIRCAANPSTNWILIDFALDTTNASVGPAKLLGWNLTAPGGNTNNTGVIFALQDTENITIGGIDADNWYNKYIDVGSNNRNLRLLDKNWLETIGALGVKGDGRDDTKNIQEAIYYAERYTGELYFAPSITNGYLMTTTWITNKKSINIKGNNTAVNVYYSQPGDVTNSRYSAAFIISSDNVTIDGISFKTISTNYNPLTEEIGTTGYYIPVNVYLATNVVIKNCSFDVKTGRGIVSSGSSMEIVNNRFLNGCGFSFGTGQKSNWLYFHNITPLGADSVHRSPIGSKVDGNYFTGRNEYKHIAFFSAADKFTFSNNKMLDIWTPTAALIAYSGDVGTTDIRGTNVYEFGGLIINNIFQGSFGTEGAIQIRLNTPTNYVQVGFNPDNMYSTIICENNIINGIGDGYNLIKANGTKIIGGSSRTTGTSLKLYGNCDPLEIRGGTYYTDGMGVINSAILFGAAYLAPGNFKNVKIVDNVFTVGSLGEYWFRNILPEIADGLTIDNNDIIFLGTAGSGDAPKVLQLTQSTNYVNLINNTFYITNGMAGRSIGLLTGTNCDFNIINNRIRLLSDIVPRGLQVGGRTINYTKNDLKTFEVQFAQDALIEGNLITYPDGNSPLEVFLTDLALVQGNRIYHQNTNSFVAVTIHATNSVFKDNVVRGNSGSDIVRATTSGTMLSGRNLIINTGGGNTKPNATGNAIIREHNWMDDPLDVETTVNSTAAVASLSRAGGGGAFNILLDGYFQPYHRDVLYKSIPAVTNDPAGHAFFVRLTNGLDRFVFGLQSSIPPLIYLGDDTNSLDIKIGGVATNALFYLNENRLIRPVSLGANMTFSAGTLNSLSGTNAGGTNNQTPWISDIDGNQFYLTNAGGIKIKHNDTSLTSLITSNTTGSATFGTLGGDAIIDASVGFIVFKLNGVELSTLGLSGWKPTTASQTIGTSLNPYSRGWFGSSGIDIGGVSILSGNDSPEGIFVAQVGSLYLRTNGVAGTILYIKESGGVGNTGWVAYNSSGGGGGGGTTTAGFPLQPQSYKLTSTPAQSSASENSWKLLFDPTADESGIWQFVMPPNYSSALKVRLLYSMTTATTGAVVIQCSLMATTPGDSADENTESYDTAIDIVDTVPGTAGYLDQLLFTMSSNDGVSAGDLVKLKINRDANSASDTAAGDFELSGISIEYLTP